MASLKKCIEQHCKNCTYDQKQEGTWRAQTEACTVRTCALWAVRPITMETIIANRKNRGIEVDVKSIVDGLPDSEEDDIEEHA